MLDRDYGSTEPFANPWTDAQHADIEHGLAAARMADALQEAAEHWRNAFASSATGDERSARDNRTLALAALHMHPTLRAQVLGDVQPLIVTREDGRAVLLQARGLLERVRDSAILPDSERGQRMAIALCCIADDLQALEEGR